METPDAAVTITDVAAEKIRDLVAANEGEQVLRIAVKGGGCSGFQYALALDSVKADDTVFEHNGVGVAVDTVSMQFDFGSEVDFVDGLQGADPLRQARGRDDGQRVVRFRRPRPARPRPRAPGSSSRTRMRRRRSGC